MISRKIQEIHLDIADIYGSQWSADDLCAYVESQRSKPLIRCITKLPTGLGGICCSLRDVDLIVINNNIEQHRKKYVFLHETSHLLLCHLPINVDKPEVVVFKEFAEVYPPDSIYFRQPGDTVFAYEQEAELLATVLLPHLSDISGDNPNNNDSLKILGYR